MNNVLIEPATLAHWLAEERDPVVLDARARLDDTDAGRTLWQDGHVPGALHADLDRDLAAAPSRQAGRHPLPDPATFAATLRGWGVTPDRSVVVYDDMGGRLAAVRAWWMLLWAGHPAVHVLDGGWQAWCAGGHPVEDDTPSVSPSDWAPDFNDSMIATADDVARGDAVVLDARAAARFRGEHEPIDAAAGHIPGSRNVPAAALLDGQSAFLSPVELTRALPDQSAVISYCGSGVSACQLILAYAILGRPLPRLYPGSWSAWSGDPARPVARGRRG